MSAFIDLTGQVFGKLTAVEYIPGKPRGKWRCSCECGSESLVGASTLKAGATQSCGCSKGHYALGKPSFQRTGKSRTPEYTAWIRMRRSCYDSDYKDWERYGARGIQVCDQWKDDFVAFLEYIGPRPTPKHSIDRFPNNNGNYEPGNVRWATATEQGRNRRSSRLMELNGVTKSMVEWAEEFGLPYRLMKSRIRLGWSLERIKATPILRQ